MTRGARATRPRAAFLFEESDRMRWVACAAVLLCLASLLASCRFIPTAEVQALATRRRRERRRAVRSGQDGRLDLGAEGRSPISRRRRARSPQVRELAAKSPDEAGAKFGYRAKSEGTPWTLMVKIEGSIVAADTESRAATIGVDATGQGKTDAIVQIGPAMRGTAIRDALDFVSFNDFTNQIDFAQFGKAFNTYVNRDDAREAAARSL